MFNKPTKIITLTTLWAVIVTGLTLTDFPQTGTTNIAEAATNADNPTLSVSVPSQCRNYVSASATVSSSIVRQMVERPEVRWTANLRVRGQNGGSISRVGSNPSAQKAYPLNYPTVGIFTLTTNSRLGNPSYRFTSSNSSRITGTLTNIEIRGTNAGVRIPNMTYNNGFTSATTSVVSPNQPANFAVHNWIGNAGNNIEFEQRFGVNTNPTADFIQRHTQQVRNPGFGGVVRVNYTYPTSVRVWGSWRDTGRWSPPNSRTTIRTSNVETRWVSQPPTRIGGPAGILVPRWKEQRREMTTQTTTTSASCNITVNVPENRFSATVTGQRLPVTARFGGRESNLTIGTKNTNSTLSGASANQNIASAKIAAPYAGDYRDRMCRIEGDVSSLPGRTTKSQTLSNSFIAAHGGNVTGVVNAVASPHKVDWGKTRSANSFLTDPRYVFNGSVNSGFDYIFRSQWSNHPIYGGITGPRQGGYLAAGQTLTVYYASYDPNFAGCYTFLTGRAPSTISTNVTVSRKLDLTGNHPAKISYVFAGFNTTGASIATPSAVQCLPEAVGLTGLTIYDAAQGNVTSGNYQQIDNDGNYRLNRDIIRHGNLGADRQLQLGGSIRGSTATDRWTTALAPSYTLNSIAGGARNPSEGSIACRYNKQSSMILLGWERTNEFLGVGNNPVYVDDTIRVLSAAAQKVRDPGRVITGNITVRLTGPGYSQTRNCSNPCSTFEFPPLTNAGSYTLSASWGGDSGLNGSSRSTTINVLKYNTQLSFSPIINSVGEADFTSTRPVPIRNLHLQNTSIPWIPTVKAGDMGSGTIRVQVQQKRFGQSNWSNFTDFRLANPNCLMSANPCPEFGIRFEREAEYRVRITYQGNRKYNASVAPSASGWSNPFWVYEDFKCFIPQNADGDSIRVYHLENNRAVSKFRGNILRDGNNIIAEYPVLIDGRHFTGIVRLGGLRTNTMFEGTPRADGELVRVFQIPVLSNSEMLNLLQGRYNSSFTEARILPNQPQNGLYRFNNVVNHNSFPINANPDGTSRKDAFRVFEVSDVGGSLKVMQEITIFDSIFYQNGVRRSGSISCEPEDSPQTGPLVMRKATVID